MSSERILAGSCSGSGGGLVYANGGSRYSSFTSDLGGAGVELISTEHFVQDLSELSGEAKVNDEPERALYELEYVD